MVIGACVACGVMAMGVGCEKRAAVVATSVAVPPPVGEIALDQRLEFADGSETFQGHGFLARSPSGTVVGVTSAHFLDQNGPKLKRLTMWTVRDGEKRDVMTATMSLGRAGDEGIVSKTNVDLSNDRLILMPERAVEVAGLGIGVMTLDKRMTIPEGEKVWLPYADFEHPKGPELVPGVVTASDVGGSVIELERDIMLTCESGSPIISQKTGLVIGTLSRGGSQKGKTTLIIAPSHAILKAMRESEAVKEVVRLEETVGK